jgi:hypothetical protein
MAHDGWVEEAGGFRVGDAVRFARPESPKATRAGQEGTVLAIRVFDPPPARPGGRPPKPDPLGLVWMNVRFPDGGRLFLSSTQLDRLAEEPADAR